MKVFQQFSGFLTARVLLIAISFPRVVPAPIGFMLVGAGVSSIVPLVYRAAGRSKVLSPGVAIAAVSTFGYMGFLFGPPFIGFMAYRFNLHGSPRLVAISSLVFTSLLQKKMYAHSSPIQMHYRPSTPFNSFIYYKPRT